MSDKNMKDLIEEHGDNARRRWREIFDRALSDGYAVDRAAGIADATIRAEVERGVLMAIGDVMIDNRARDLALMIDNHASYDGTRIDPDHVTRIVEEARRIVAMIG